MNKACCVFKLITMNWPSEVMADFMALPEVAKRVASKGPHGPQVLNNIPVSTRKNVYIHPWHLDMSEEAKYGQGGKWPSTVAIRAHFPSVVQRGYESEKEAIEIKFPSDLHMTGGTLPMFSIQYIDGHAKATMVLAVFALLDYLVSCLECFCCNGMKLDFRVGFIPSTATAEGVAPHEIAGDEEMVDLIASLKFLRANYVHFDSPELCMYEALSLELTSSLFD